MIARSARCRMARKYWVNFTDAMYQTLRGRKCESHPRGRDQNVKRRLRLYATEKRSEVHRSGMRVARSVSGAGQFRGAIECCLRPVASRISAVNLQLPPTELNQTPWSNAA